MRIAAAGLFASLLFSPVNAQETQLTKEPGLPEHLQDRGTGVPVSMFATWIREGEWIVYPFYEYYHDKDAEYQPSELGYNNDNDFKGKFTGHEGLIFIGHGITADLAFELEAAVITAEQTKAVDDPSNMPAKVKESGLGDVEGQLRWRFARETPDRPEGFTYFETVAPAQKQKLLIGTSDWELKLGFGATKGYRWGTMTARAAAEYELAEKKLDFGEMALEYVKKLSPRYRVYLGVEGAQDEWEGIAELQWHYSRRSYFKVNNAFGLSPKATDWAPELGVVFVF